MRLADGSFINNVARLEKEEEIAEASEAIDKEIAETTVEEEIKNSERENLSDEESF